jgi:hypothetical protein
VPVVTTVAYRSIIGNMRRPPARIIPFPGRPPEPESRPNERRLAELHRCDQAEAVVVKSLLESEGIPTFLRSRLAHSVHPFTVGAQGEVAVLVPPSEEAHARVLLLRLERPPRD